METKTNNIHKYDTHLVMDLDDPFFAKRGIDSYLDFMKDDLPGYMPKRNYENRAFMLVMKIIKALWECIMEDMLEHDTSLLISQRPFIKIEISYLKNFNSKRYVYRPETNGRFYKVIVIIGRKFGEALDLYYFTRSRTKLKKAIVERIKKNYSWS